jgi:hypothetical protein
MKIVYTIYSKNFALFLLIWALNFISRDSAAQGGVAVGRFSGGLGPGSASNGIYFGLGNSPGIFGPLTNALFDNYHFYPSDVGHVFTANSQNDPDFNAYVSTLTDGFSGMSYEFALDPCCWSKASKPTREFFQGLPPDGHGEFYGYNITSIDLRVAQLEDRFDGGVTPVKFSFEASVYYEPVPEPATVVFLGLGGFVWYLLRRVRPYRRSL